MSETIVTVVRGTAIALLFVIAGCFGDAEGAIGPCTLKVSVDEQGDWRTMEQPPYTIHLGTPASQVTNGPSALIFGGNGWQRVDLLMRHASGEQVTGTLTGRDVSDESTGFPVPRPGQWEIRLSDPVVGCQRVFIVEAIAP
jgi:hypothetical protein